MVKDLIDRYYGHDVARDGAALTYYLLFAIFPLLVFISTLVGLMELDVESVMLSMSRILPDMVKKELPGSGAVTADQAAALVLETCRAELVHGASCLLGLAFLWLWPGWGGAIVLAVWVLLANLPFILIQRYNRPRLMHLAALLRKRAQRKGEQNARTDPDL